MSQWSLDIFLSFQNHYHWLFPFLGLCAIKHCHPTILGITLTKSSWEMQSTLQKNEPQIISGMGMKIKISDEMFLLLLDN